MAWLGAGTRTGTNLDTIEWQPNTLWSGFQLVPAMTNGDCMMYVVCASNKVASHFIANIDTALGTANPGMSVRYWQPTDSWIAYHNVAGTTGSVTASAASYTASTKILLGVRVSGTALSISVNGAVTTGGTATLFTASRSVLNLENSANLVGVYDAYSTTGYSETLAVRLEGFLAHKHGITLANGHPYRLSPPTLEWIPTDDSGLTIWYDFADSSTITVTGAGISDLKNKKNPATYNLTQSTDASRPTWNGSKATGIANGASPGLSVTASITWSNAAHFALSYCELPAYNGSLTQRLFQVANVSGNATVLYVLPSAPNRVAYRQNNSANTGADATVLSGYTTGRPSLLGVLYDGATTKNIYAEGALLSSDTNVLNTATLGTSMQVLPSGAIVIGDFLATASTDTATRQRLEGYLAWKRGLQSSLPSGHPYRTKKPIYQEWTPADDASCIIWYDFADASTITVTGAGISQITNKVPGGTFTLVQATDADRPSWDGSKATGRGSGNGLAFSGTVGFTNAAYSAFIVAQYPSPNANTQRALALVDGVSFSQHLMGSNPNGTDLIYRASNTGGAAVVCGTYTADTPFLMSYAFDGASNKKAWKNGTSTLDNNTANGPIVLSHIRMLNASTTASNYDIIVTSATSTSIRQKYEGYLAWKRGLASALPSDHPYKSRPPLTTD